MKKAGRTKQQKLTEDILQELAAIGLTRATDVLSIADEQIVLRAPSQMDAPHAAAIASVEKTSAGWKIKFYDKLKALELLGSHYGLFGSQDSRTQAEENNLLEAIVASTQEEISTRDIQELQQTANPGNDLVE